MPIPKDKILYDKVKKQADTVYEKNSAYKSMYIQKLYQNHGGEYKNDGKKRALKQWMDEKWININPLLGKTGYPTYRPIVRVNKNSPKTVEEIPLKRLKEQYRLKQKIKGNKNLPKF
jgi:hypothetical protein